eukprot:895191-Alexandrium_andersonii.AAC.1
MYGRAVPQRGRALLAQAHPHLSTTAFPTSAPEARMPVHDDFGAPRRDAPKLPCQSALAYGAAPAGGWLREGPHKPPSSGA